MAMELLGRVLVTRKSYDDAERTYGEALPLSRKVLGEDHPDTLRCRETSPLCCAAWAGPRRPLRSRAVEALRTDNRIRRYKRLNEPRWTSAFGSWRADRRGGAGGADPRPCGRGGGGVIRERSHRRRVNRLFSRLGELEELLSQTDGARGAGVFRRR